MTEVYSPPSTISCKGASEALNEVAAEIHAEAHEGHKALAYLRNVLEQMENVSDATKAMAVVLKQTDNVPANVNEVFRSLQTAFGMKDSHAWLATRPDLTVMDPDGWDRSDYDASMAELISEEEFNHRLHRSTVIKKAPDETGNSNSDPDMIP